jgi:hypothetical protein
LDKQKVDKKAKDEEISKLKDAAKDQAHALEIAMVTASKDKENL